ncbi:hypothetical protein GCM10009672_22580 [Nesterenkonia lutea]
MRRISVVSFAAVLGLSVTSCGGDDAGAEPNATDVEPSAGETSPEGGSADPEEPSGEGGAAEDPEPSPSPVPASSDGPAENWPEPEVPDEIYEETEEGALAALRYWFEADLYMELTGEPEPFELVSSADCQICGGRIGQFEKLYAKDGGWHLAEGAKVEDEIVSSVSENQQVSILFTIREGDFAEFSADGEQLVEGGEESLSGVEATLHYQGDRWRVLELYFPDDTTAEN